MKPVIMPTLTSDNNSPLLWKAVQALEESGIDIHRVRFSLGDPECRADDLKEIYHQRPAGNVAVTPDTSVEVAVNRNTGYFVETKRDWFRMVADGKMSKVEVSDRLMKLGELQLLLRSPPMLLDALLSHYRASGSSLFENDLGFSRIFSESERMTLATLYPLKRNSHLPFILSRMFTRILNMDIRFMDTLNDDFPQKLSVRVSCGREEFRKYQDKVVALEDLLIPITCNLIYIFEFPVAILNDSGACLDNVQLG